MNTHLSSPSMNKNTNIALWVLQAVLAAAFAAAGASKLLGVEQMVELFTKVGVGQWFRYVTGAVEVVCAVGLVVPWLTQKAALLLTITMVCAALTHLFLIGGSPVPAIVLAVLSGVVAYFRRA